MAERVPLSQEERESAFKDILGPDLGAIVQAAHLLSADKSTTSRLLQVLETERRLDNRHAILYALTWHADLATWNLMVSIFADSNETPKVRGQAAEALSYMFAYQRSDSKEFEAAVKALIDGLKDPSPEVRYCAVNALGSTGHPPLEPVIRGMLRDSTPVKGWIGTVGDEASRALEWLELAYSMRQKDGL
jgi:HEAT repeat protein